MSGNAIGEWGARLRAEGPFLLLLAAALAALPTVQGQGGSLHQGWVAALAVLAAPAAAIEPVLAVARLVIRIEGTGR